MDVGERYNGAEMRLTCTQEKFREKLTLKEESFSTRENQQKCRNRIFVAATHVHHYENWVTFSGKAQNPR